MAASGLVEMTDAAAMEKAMNVKVPFVRLTPMRSIFPQTLEKNGVRNGSDIAKCLEKLNCRLIPPKDNNSDSFPKTNNLLKNSGYFRRDSVFPNRLGRSPSTDSVVVSSLSSDQGSVDSCHFSSNASDSNSVSSPSSPEEPERYSRAGSPHSVPPSPPDLNHHDGIHQIELDNSSENICPITRNGNYSTCEGNEPVSFANRISHNLCSETESATRENYLYQSNNNNLVPNSNFKSFQSSTDCCVPVLMQTNENERTQLSTSVNSSVNNKCQINKNCETKLQSSFTSTNSTNQSNCSSSEFRQCNWTDCDVCIEGNAELLEHIRLKHVQTQKDRENYVCLWRGCKVFGKPSCSLSWLERHILRHGGNKPFKCIVDNCNKNFPTQAALQRHVNSHFDGHTNGIKNGRYRDDSGLKSFKRKKHLKYKRISASAKTKDFFDPNIMEQIRFKLIEVQSSQQSSSTNNYQAITFHSTVIAIRKTKSGKMEALLHWSPENIIPDSWVSHTFIDKYKSIPFLSLPFHIRNSVEQHLQPTFNNEIPRVKQRRK